MKGCSILRVQRVEKGSGCHDRHDAHEKDNSVFLRDADGLHPHEDHASGNYIIEDLRRPQRYTKPVCEDLCAAIDIPADADHDCQSIHDKDHPAEYLLGHAVEQFPFKTFDQLRAAIVIGQFCDDQVQDHIDDVSKRHHPHHIQHTVLRGQIGHRNNAGPDAVAHDHTDCFKCGQPCF